jgi:hypothetical protein
VTEPVSDRDREQRATDAGWDAILVWNGMMTRTARSDGAAAAAGAEVGERSRRWTPELLGVHQPNASLGPREFYDNAAAGRRSRTPSRKSRYQ